MNGTPAAKSRRNLERTSGRTEWQQAHSEDHPLRYRLYFATGSGNLKCDRMTLLAEIRERVPYMIERIPPKEAVLHFANGPAHVHLLDRIKLVEIP